MAEERESVAPADRELADTVLDAFTGQRLVGIGESHGLQNHHDALQLLLMDPRLPEVVDDIVVEFGNARYQDTMDRFIAGRPVADADLRAVWRTPRNHPGRPGTRRSTSSSTGRCARSTERGRRAASSACCSATHLCSKRTAFRACRINSRRHERNSASRDRCSGNAPVG